MIKKTLATAALIILFFIPAIVAELAGITIPN